jgi:hypothetical protein
MTIDRIASEITDARLNELYWSSGYTIDEILNELGIARNTLYASIEPLGTGRSCVPCGAELVFTNRTSRAAGSEVCLHCGAERVSEPAGAWADASMAAHAPAVATGNGADSEGRWIRLRGELGAVAPERAALIGGAAALGLMVGAAATRAWRD